MAFLTVKVIGAHAFVHFSNNTDSIETCAFCDYFLTQNTTPFTLNNASDLKIPIVFVAPEVNNQYTYTYYNKEIFYRFYNKPPPASL